MVDDESWLQNKSDISNISVNVKKHIKHGRHKSKTYTFADDPVSFILLYYFVCIVKKTLTPYIYILYFISKNAAFINKLFKFKKTYNYNNTFCI